jgi:hypothetical protein
MCFDGGKVRILLCVYLAKRFIFELDLDCIAQKNPGNARVYNLREARG